MLISFTSLPADFQAPPQFFSRVAPQVRHTDENLSCGYGWIVEARASLREPRACENGDERREDRTEHGQLVRNAMMPLVHTVTIGIPPV
jgi:hypothetical protein